MCVIGELATAGVGGFFGEAMEILLHLLGLGASHLFGCGEADAMVKSAEHNDAVMASALNRVTIDLHLFEGDYLSRIVELRDTVADLENKVLQDSFDLEKATKDVAEKQKAYDEVEHTYEICIQNRCMDLLEAEEAAHAAYQACLDLK